MSPVTERWNALAPWMHSLLRIVAAYGFILHGTTKLFALPVGQRPGTPVDLFSQMGVAGVLEVFGGSLLLIGLFTRPIAFLVCGEMAVAYFQAHLPRSIFPILNGGEAALLYCFIWLYISATGPGPISVDALLAGRRARTSR